MASAVVPQPSQDQATELQRINVALDATTSSSPFPSPSSTFIPPPIPGAHEFANKPPNNIRFLRKKSTSHSAKESEVGHLRNDGKSNPNPATLDVHNTAGSVRKDFTTPTSAKSVLTPTAPTPTVSSIHHNRSFSAFPALTEATPAAEPNRPPSTLPSSGSNTVPVASTSATTVPITQTPPSTVQAPPTAQIPQPTQTPPSINQTPLSPNSPMITSPQTTPLSQHSSLTSSRPAPASPTPSRRASAVPSITLHRRASNLRYSITSASSPRNSRSLSLPIPPPIKIRDFGFPANDERHTGKGPDAPQPKPWNPNRSSGLSDASSGGWGGLKFGFGFPWAFGKDKANSSPAPTPETPTSDSDGYYEYEDEELLSAQPEEDLPLYPGLYRALYAFEPEGTAEMELVEDQIVRVVGRGGGVGWAIVERESGGPALVPESYLEVVQLDSDDEQDTAEQQT